MVKNQFPLVADGIAISDPAKQMALYENEDLITNIRGYYQDKEYDDIARNEEFTAKATSRQAPSSKRFCSNDEKHHYVKEARQKAKQDLKEKDRLILPKKWPMFLNRFLKSNSLRILLLLKSKQQQK